MELPFIKQRFQRHDAVKDHLLLLIEQHNTTVTEYDTHITNSDYFDKDKMNHPYNLLASPLLLEHTRSIFNTDDVIVNEVWFQQYLTNDTHTWHIHNSCHFTNVYFLELPDPAFKTEIREFGSENLFLYEAEEGDIITLPSCLFHRSPVLKSDERKTVIAFNSSLLS